MEQEYVVRVIQSDTGEVVREMGPMRKHKADKVIAGLDMRVDFDVYHTDMIAVEKAND